MPDVSNNLPKLVLFEDAHLLVINKPAGWNTHAPSPFAGEGVFDWLRHREPRWASLAIIHRLDKETSGVMVFARSREANRSLTTQFEGRDVGKKYLLLTDRPVKRPELTVVTNLVRDGEKYVAVPEAPPRRGSGNRHPEAGQRAETRFRLLEETAGRALLEAIPVTGRTHQIRVHAAASGFPILGDELYGGTPAARVHLHAVELTLRHPATDALMTFTTPARFLPLALRKVEHRGDGASLLSTSKSNSTRRGKARTHELKPDLPTSAATMWELREAIINPEVTTAFRLIHGASDGWPGYYVDRLGDFVLVQSSEPANSDRAGAPAPGPSLLTSTASKGMKAPRGVYRKVLTRQVRGATAADVSPRLVAGEAAPDRFEVLENGVRFELSFSEGYSVGLFLDQRDNRRRLLVNHVAADFGIFSGGAGGREVLNTFAYTCGFSVCAAKAGARVTSVDLSKKYLEWGRRNFALNGLDAGAHDFIYGDTFDWLRRLAKKGRAFDVVALDPPTFSQSKESGVFRAEKDFGRLVAAVLPVLKPGGVLFASTNVAALRPEDFVRQIQTAAAKAGRRELQQHYVPQPPDFPVSRDEPAYLKTGWFRWS